MSAQRPLILLALLVACTGADEGIPLPDEGQDLLRCEEWELELVQVFTVDDLEEPDGEGQVSYVGPGVAIADLDGDGDLDLAWATAAWPLRILHNDGTGALELEDVTTNGGRMPSVMAASAGDVNQDGKVDLWLGRNEGYEDLIFRAGVSSDYIGVELEDSGGHSVSGAWADPDLDGAMDLLVARHAEAFTVDMVHAGEVQGGGTLLYPNTGEHLTSRTEAWPFDHLHDLAFQGLWLDHDDDGDLDAYQVNDFGWVTGGNALFDNQGDGTFAIDADCDCDIGIAGMGGAVADFDEDGWPDLHMTNAGSPVMLLNDGTGAYYDTTLASGAEIPLEADRITSWGTAAVDFDGDGHLEIAVAYGPINFFVEVEDDEYVGLPSGEVLADEQVQRDALLVAQGDGTWAEEGSERGFDDEWIGRSIVSADLDQDGRVELVTSGWIDADHPELRVYRVNGTCPPGVTVAPMDGPLSTGARVEVDVGDRTLTRWILPSAVFSSSAPEVTVGLDGATTADEIRVTWPDGRSWSEANVTAGTIVRPE